MTNTILLSNTDQRIQFQYTLKTYMNGISINEGIVFDISNDIEHVIMREGL